MRQILNGKKKDRVIMQCFALDSEEESCSIAGCVSIQRTLREVHLEKMREKEECTVYFPDFAENQLPERDYLISVISSNNK